VTGDGERECLKIHWIGQSAAKPHRNMRKVQRLGKVTQDGRNAHERATLEKLRTQKNTILAKRAEALIKSQEKLK